MTTSIDFIRHGEPEGGNLYRGSGTDDPLSVLGWQQMWGAIDGKEGWEAVVTSPMSRCHAFALAVAKKYRLPLEIVHDLREAGYGAWEGLSPQDLQVSQMDAYRALYADPVNCRPAGAEPLHVFTARVMQALQYVLALYAGKHVLLVSHAGTMRAIMSQILHAPVASQQSISLPYAAFFSLKQDDVKGIQLVF